MLGFLSNDHYTNHSSWWKCQLYIGQDMWIQNPCTRLVVNLLHLNNKARGRWGGVRVFTLLYILKCCHIQRISESFGFAIQSREDFGFASFGFMVVSASLNNISVISWRSVLLVDETGIPEKTSELLEHKHFQINWHVFNHLNS